MRKEKVQLFSASHVVRQPRQMTKKAFVGVNIIYASVIFAFISREITQLNIISEKLVIYLQKLIYF